MCTQHYQRWKLYGATDLPVRLTKTETGQFQHGTPQGFRFHGCRCEECVGWREKYVVAWKAKNPDYVRIKMLRSHGLTLADYAGMVADQGGVCAVCGNPPTPEGRNKFLCVDHCHETGLVRGLLCTGCNAAAGMLREDPHIVRSLARYIERARAAPYV
jgi:hypothetical protein